jgi:hypothetical protein
VVAYGQKGGYVDLESSYHLANVGCESCHGPAGGHNKKESVEEKLARKKLSAVEQYGKVCVTCHDEAHSIAFKPEKGIPIVGHHFDRTLSEVDWLARRSKLQSGEAERPLLEFPAGQVQGSAACASCHKEIHAGWKNDPHGKAMDSLVKKGSDKDVGCVKCHSTLKDSKNPGNLASFEPGVGCESCHGPGEAHLKAGGGKGNIVALTKSCPVCIIESICTSCHTREQDPDFELEKALAAIKHPAH